jgi:hypothetical protein
MPRLPAFALALLAISSCSELIGPTQVPMTITVLDDVAMPEVFQAGDTVAPGVVAVNGFVRFRVSVRIENHSDFALSLPPCVAYHLQRADGSRAIQYNYSTVNCSAGYLPARAMIEDEIEWTACTGGPGWCLGTWALGSSVSGEYRVVTSAGRYDGGPSRESRVTIRSNRFMALTNELQRVQ